MGFATAPADPEAGSVYDIPIGSPQRDTRASREAFLERGGEGQNVCDDDSGCWDRFLERGAM